ncbi:hypothetical protein GCM10007874_17780 [Labrys miyagiensis]|uniref:Winged helix domain-containing protein n=1 Tax=Labrys miyagiensis TaxID=346912 RepID=A0ABQ6CEG0_9HYPH|nr:hypothetical protein [Labrys miyagiensis]GLS18761.1 hypothetical protein GCM10007874_17780 [Labrys miyagiensis]
MSDVRAMVIRVGETAHTFEGRAAWALSNLIKAGSKGCTPIENPAPRWSHYVFLLRRAGLVVETVTENHGGAYAGHHARYVLRSPIEVLQEVRA